MNSNVTILAESSACYKFLASGPTRISLSGNVVRIEGPNGVVRVEARVDLVDSVSVKHQWFWEELTLRFINGEEYSVGGLGTQDTTRLSDALLTEGAVLKASVAEAKSRAPAIANEIKRINDEFDRLFSGDSYVRHSSSLIFHEDLVTVVRKCTGLIREQLASGGLDALHTVEPYVDSEAFEKQRQKANGLFIDRNVNQVRSVALQHFDRKLTDEQAVAIATDEDVTLVLAGAGTGKTSVILGKVAYLMENQGVAPEEILVLAFNRAAAKEIRERLPMALKGTEIKTFHAFGRGVIAKHGVAPDISKMAEDEQLLLKVVNDWLLDLLGVSRPDDEVTEFVAYNLAPYASQFDFDTPGEYHEYVRNWELRTLNGDLVKSFEELEIANFLTLNGIEFRYEHPFPVPTADKRHRQYKPDFYLPKYGIYIEHFALNEKWQPPPAWPHYLEGVHWKRGIHEENGTTLIETYSWQHRRGTLRDNLRESLEAHGVRFQQVSITNLLQRLAKWVASWLARLLVRFLNHVKTNVLSTEELRRRSNSGFRSFRQEAFLALFERMRDRYASELVKEKALDFHDLINRATDLIRNGQSAAAYRYVLVDEFQDIAAGRMRLLQALDSPTTAFFLVGDDWQSINRFAGSDVNLFRNCDEYLGHVQKRELSQTFRYGGDILGPSVDFVCNNPAQTQRTMRPLDDVVDNGISIVAYEDEKQGMEFALRDIELRDGDDDQNAHEVLVLGRYGFNNPGLTPNWTQNGQLRVRYSTVHSAKGQEADYVIVLGLKSGRYGFPSKIEDDPLMQLVMPSKVRGEIEHAEERRLFYVAMTRARRGAYLVVDPERPSEFVTELRKRHRFRRCGDVTDDLRPKCPRCLAGKLKVSKSGDNLRCTNSPACDHLAPRCPNCKSGYTVASGSGTTECTNPECDKPGSACPKCRIGVLTRKSGSYGDFLGCSEYWSEPPCRYTMNDLIRPDGTRSGASRRFVKR